MNDKNYKVVWKVFFSPKDQIHAENLTKEQAEDLSKHLNETSSDEYEWTVVEPMSN